jgi:hypothetical protein
MRARAFLLLISIAAPAAAPASAAPLEEIKACALPAGEEGERLAQRGIAILESGDGRFDEAVRSLEEAKASFERTVACLPADPGSREGLTEQDLEFLDDVRGTMREGLDRLGALREMVTSDSVAAVYLEKCRRPRMLEASASYEHAITLRARGKGATDEIGGLLDAAAGKLDEVEACARSMEPFRRDLAKGARKILERIGADSEAFRARIATAREIR